MRVGAVTIADDELPQGVQIMPLRPHADERGVFTEMFRQSWTDAVAPLQWNAVRSAANVLRGFHVHIRHTDYLTILMGRLELGVKDIRPESPTYGLTRLLTLDAAAPIGVVLPPGVAHGFYFAEPAMHLYAVSHYWSHADELACRWDDLAVGIDWPTQEPLLSQRDRDAISFPAMVERFLAGRRQNIAFDEASVP